MDIKEVLFNIVNYFSYTRGAGHTKTVLNGAKNTDDCLIMVSDDSQAKTLSAGNIELRDKIIDFSQLPWAKAPWLVMLAACAVRLKHVRLVDNSLPIKRLNVRDRKFGSTCNVNRGVNISV